LREASSCQSQIPLLQKAEGREMGGGRERGIEREREWARARASEREMVEEMSWRGGGAIHWEFNEAPAVVSFFPFSFTSICTLRWPTHKKTRLLFARQSRDGNREMFFLEPKERILSARSIDRAHSLSLYPLARPLPLPLARSAPRALTQPSRLIKSA
jgi:hypothetical protein